MKNFAKNIITSLLLLSLCCGVMCSCSESKQTVSEVSQAEKEDSSAEPTKNTIKIPDIEKLDIANAKTLLAGKGLIPKVEYEYNNDYDYDLVIRTEPAIGSEVDEDTPVTLYVCKGPIYYTLSDSVGRIWNIEGIEDFIWWSEAEDGWGTKGFTDIYAVRLSTTLNFMAISAQHP